MEKRFIGLIVFGVILLGLVAGANAYSIVNFYDDKYGNREINFSEYLQNFSNQHTSSYEDHNADNLSKAEILVLLKDYEAYHWYNPISKRRHKSHFPGPDHQDCNPNPVPEPATIILLGLGIIGSGFAARKKRNK